MSHRDDSKTPVVEPAEAVDRQQQQQQPSLDAGGSVKGEALPGSPVLHNRLLTEDLVG